MQKFESIWIDSSEINLFVKAIQNYQKKTGIKVTSILIMESYGDSTEIRVFNSWASSLIGIGIEFGRLSNN